MKKALLILILFLLSTLKVQAGGPIYFPVIQQDNPCYGGTDMSNWQVIVPASAPIINKVKNPSAETTGNFAALAGTTVTRDTAVQHYGLYSYRVQMNADNEGITLDLDTLANSDHWVTVRLSGTLLAAWDWSLDNVTYTVPTLLEAIDVTWSLYGLVIPAAQANGATVLYIRQKGAGSGDFWIDGIQVEEDIEGDYTTYCDGTQVGCEWNGAEHASSSTRSENSRAGGVVYDLEDDYGLKISGMSGTGTAPQELFVDSYSQLPGGELNTIKTNSRVITLTGVITGTTLADFHAKKQALKSILAKDAYPQDVNGYQPVRLRYTGAMVHKEIAVHYEGGLEATITADKPCAWEDVAVRFIAPNPYWYEIGESAALLDTNDSATFRTVAGRLRSTGQWDNLGPPNVAGTYTTIEAIVEDAIYVYFAGNFVNFDNGANSDYIVRYNKATGVYSSIAALNAAVHAMAIAPNGDLYIGGEFTNASGVAAADYLAVLLAGASSFTAVGTPLAGAAAITRVNALAFDQAGILYITGGFTNWADIANADNIVSWTGSVYAALSTGLDATGTSLAVGPGNILYVGGTFSNAGGVAAENIVSWVGGVFVALGASDAVDGTVHTLAISPDGILYLGGVFGNPGAGIAGWNGTNYFTLGAGVSPTDVRKLAYGPDGILYLGGQFTSAGGIILSDRGTRWNGYAYSHLDIDLPGTPLVYAILPSKYVDPVVPQKYSLYLGFTTTGTGTFAGIETIANGGTVPAFPKIIFNRSGGTTATIQTVKNERNGQEILFNYALQDGETLTIDLAQTKKSIVSSFFGPRQDAVLPNSDFGSFALLSGNNDVTSFVSTTGSPTITAWMLFKDFYDSQD